MKFLLFFYKWKVFFIRPQAGQETKNLNVSVYCFCFGWYTIE